MSERHTESHLAMLNKLINYDLNGCISYVYYIHLVKDNDHNGSISMDSKFTLNKNNLNM